MDNVGGVSQKENRYPIYPLPLVKPFFFSFFGDFQLTLNSVLYSTTYTAGISAISEEFHKAEVVTTLGLTLYLLGISAGGLILAPLSEMLGRKPVLVVCQFLSMILIIPCGVGKTFVTLLVVRFFGAIFAGATISLSPGIIADVTNEERRFLAMSIWSIGPLNGPGKWSEGKGAASCPLSEKFCSNFWFFFCSIWPSYWRFRHSISRMEIHELARDDLFWVRFSIMYSAS